ncbi:MAG: hypothetical protein DWQ34_17150 [Planctomycetota bacterium]|nr:MAG: hypothetical protein DWQ34_17150 [Planctomycetota bacterium]REK24130.1 MAG: hypothetical protein DWQ41_13860 [Planctomycetota bacterium]REK38293.1 MAG: hypothetical protein DWQ45_04785 [Planctomycetota bacterium]
MATDVVRSLDVPADLIDAVRNFPTHRSVAHCGETFTVGPFEHYATCPQCGERLKLRSFSANYEIEDVFDAVFEWMNDPQAQVIAEARRRVIQVDDD